MDNGPRVQGRTSLSRARLNIAMNDAHKDKALGSQAAHEWADQIPPMYICCVEMGTSDVRIFIINQCGTT